MNAFKEEYQQVADDVFSKLSDDEIESLSSQLEKSLDEEYERLRAKYGIPEDVYLTSAEPIREQHLGLYLEDLNGWASGTLSRSDSARLILDLDLEEMDEYFVLLGLPNFSFSSRQRELLETALVELGCGHKSGYVKVNKICNQLLALDSDT